MNSYYITGIILSHENIGEKDRLITFLTEERGKLRAVARSSRRISSKMAGSLEPFNLVRCWMHTGKTFDIIKNVQLIKTFPNVIKNIDIYITASRMFEFIQVTVQENDESQDMFRLLLGVLTALDRYDSLNSIKVFFWLNVLILSGYRMRLDRCVCGREDVKGFSPSMGGVVCIDCMLKTNDSILISNSALDTLRMYEQIRLSSVVKREIPDTLMREIDTIIDRFRLCHTNIKLRSEEVTI
ncbi:MAG TPA: DNA repair protein RecO [bacterium]|mgnify:FL=1|nr:DNA repair protein RecO [bacterium]HOP55863.1 DNA repair protein RecO [bacterium]HRU32218.1 DNA repair protein RecO [bacterium]